jgi:hypothetical protein
VKEGEEGSLENSLSLIIVDNNDLLLRFADFLCLLC